MAIGLGNNRKAALLDNVLGAVALSAADATVWIALVTGTFTVGTSDVNLANGVLTGNPEVTTGNWTNYARVSVTNNTTNWPNSTTNTGTSTVTKSNGTIINFTANATVTGTGPTPTGFIVTNSATLNAAANIVAVGILTAGNSVVVNGNAVSFAIGALVVTIA